MLRPGRCRQWGVYVAQKRKRRLVITAILGKVEMDAADLPRSRLDSGQHFKDDTIGMSTSRSGLGVCCATTPSAMCFWTAVFLLAYGAT
ncbi:MAG: hypothetical protein ACRD1V_14575, partial [Vicinamibacterales bacterium]